MVWLKPSEWKKQKYIELRLYAPKNEKIFLSEFLKWLKEALKYTTIIVVEGNL